MKLGFVSAILPGLPLAAVADVDAGDLTKDDARHTRDLIAERRVGILATPLEYHRPKRPGLGEIDRGRFLSGLGETGTAGPVCVEVEDREVETSLETRKAELRRSAAHLRGFMARV